MASPQLRRNAIQRRTLGSLPASSPPFKVETVSLPPGDAGTAATIARMREMALGSEGAMSPLVRKTALDIVRPVAARDAGGELTALFNWIKSNIKFRGEFRETLQTPLVTLQFGAGDCDCQATLLCGLALALGYECRFVTIAADEGDDFSHVYAQVRNAATGDWYTLDTTVPGATAGWTPAGQNIRRARAWKPMSGMGLGSLAGFALRRRGPKLGETPQQQVPPWQAALAQGISDVTRAASYRIAYGQQAPIVQVGGPFGGTLAASDTIAGIPAGWVLLGGAALLIFVFAGRRP